MNVPNEKGTDTLRKVTVPKIAIDYESPVPSGTVVNSLKAAKNTYLQLYVKSFAGLCCT